MNQTPKPRMSPSAIIIAIILFQGIAAAIFSDSQALPLIIAVVLLLALSAVGASFLRRSMRPPGSGPGAQRPSEQGSRSSGNGAGAGSASYAAERTFREGSSANAPVRLILAAVLALGGVVFVVISVIGEVGSPTLLYIVGGIVAVAIGVGAAVWSTRRR
jgi:protein-S-isoprenylcysteine O-methyltransferase Ste14